jgi:hypothetical protein
MKMATLRRGQAGETGDEEVRNSMARSMARGQFWPGSNFSLSSHGSSPAPSNDL